MVNFNKKSRKNGSKSIPTVIFNDCNELKLMLVDWLGNNMSANDYMGLLMYKLGVVLDEDDVIQIHNFNKIDSSFRCIINDKDIYYMKFKNLGLAGFNPEIELSICNVKKIYECIPVNGVELGMRVINVLYSKYERGVCFKRYLSTENAVFTINNGKYILELGVSKPKEVMIPLFDEFGHYSKYKLDNEDELVNYLTSLKFPISIIDVYKKICEISLGDISHYPRILIKVSKKNLGGNDKITDLIHLENGNLEDFGMTVGDTNRILLMDKDGYWSYEMNDDYSLIKISSDMDSKMNYNICVLNNASLEDVKLLIESNMKDALEDVKNTKILVKKIFNKDIGRW